MGTVGSSLHTHALLSRSPSSAQPAVLPLLVTGQSSTAEVNETFILRRLTADKLLKLDTV